MSLSSFATEFNNGEATVTVLNRNRDRPLYRLLTRLFNDDAVTVKETTTDDHSSRLTDVVVVEKTDPDTAFAVSSFDDLQEQLLLVNSDIYISGARSLDAIETPDVITELDEIPFTVTGYPDDPKEKLLLIEMSRHIEAMAWQAGDGRLDTGFQYLSRIEDEIGTRRVYERLADQTNVQPHVYGVPDTEVSLSGVTVHGRHCEELRQSWFVVYQSVHHPHEAAALVATETAPNTWEGCWTYDAEKVGSILDYLDRTYS